MSQSRPPHIQNLWCSNACNAAVMQSQTFVAQYETNRYRLPLAVICTTLLSGRLRHYSNRGIAVKG